MRISLLAIFVWTHLRFTRKSSRPNLFQQFCTAY